MCHRWWWAQTKAQVKAQVMRPPGQRVWSSFGWLQLPFKPLSVTAAYVEPCHAASVGAHVCPAGTTQHEPAMRALPGVVSGRARRQGRLRCLGSLCRGSLAQRRYVIGPLRTRCPHLTRGVCSGQRPHRNATPQALLLRNAFQDNCREMLFELRDDIATEQHFVTFVTKCSCSPALAFEVFFTSPHVIA